MQSSQSNSWAALPRLIYTHNPFYLVSALMVLVGLHQSLGDDGTLTGDWLLMGILCGYVVLLAAAGFVIVRFGKVWDDARTILLVILLLFVALSVSFDTLVLVSPIHGSRFLLAGLVFAVTVSESVFGGLGIRFRASYRLPYYLTLAVLFVYPLVLGKLSVDGHDTAMSWGVFLFPVAAALALLTLWPAARTQGDQEPPNGTPWSWPWFPWSIFGFLLLLIAMRSYTLSVAFEPFKGSHASFQLYFLAPLILVTALLLLEAGIANRSVNAKNVALMLPIAILFISLPGTRSNPVANRFLTMMIETFGSPAQLALGGAATFYAIAALRGMRTAEVALLGCLALASFVDAHTISLSTFAKLQAWPFAVIAAVELPLGLWRKTSWRVVDGTLAGIVAGASSGWSPVVATHSWYILCHASGLLVLMLGAFYDDRWAREFRRIISPVVACMAIAAMSYEYWLPQVPLWYHAIVVLGLCIVGTLYWRRTPSVSQQLAMLTSYLALVILSARCGYLALRSSPLDKGLPWLAGGLVALALALSMSLLKGGLLSRGWRKLRVIGNMRP